MTQNVPKHPTDCDETLKAVLDNVIFNNANNYHLISYEIRPNEVVLHYAPGPCAAN